MIPGTKVRMSESLKRILIKNNCSSHVQEFGDCIGVVIGPMFPNGEGPEIDVRWQPSNFRYGYDPSDLVEIA